MNFLARTLFRRQFARTFAEKSEKVTEKPHPKAKKLKELQRKFTVDDGVPVYLKGGTPDKILFQVTAAGLGIGLLMAINVLYCLIIPGGNPPPAIAVKDQDEN